MTPMPAPAQMQSSVILSLSKETRAARSSSSARGRWRALRRATEGRVHMLESFGAAPLSHHALAC